MTSLRDRFRGERERGRAQEAHVFKFADRPTLYFNCQLQLSLKDHVYGCSTTVRLLFLPDFLHFQQPKCGGVSSGVESKASFSVDEARSSSKPGYIEPTSRIPFSEAATARATSEFTTTTARAPPSAPSTTISPVYYTQRSSTTAPPAYWTTQRQSSQYPTWTQTTRLYPPTFATYRFFLSSEISVQPSNPLSDDGRGCFAGADQRPSSHGDGRGQ